MASSLDTEKAYIHKPEARIGHWLLTTNVNYHNERVHWENLIHSWWFVHRCYEQPTSRQCVVDHISKFRQVGVTGRYTGSTTDISFGWRSHSSDLYIRHYKAVN